MKLLPSSSVAFAGVAVVIASIASDPSSANPRIAGMPVTGRGVRGEARFPARTASRMPLVRPRRAGATPLPCPTNENSNTAFLGITNASDYAAGLDSGVVAGGTNQACGDGSGILSGYQNLIGPPDTSGGANDGGASGIVSGMTNFITAEYAFIGAGTNSGITGANSSIGSGNGNMVSGVDSAVESGFSNSAASNYSFIGSGVAGLTEGTGAFIGAGGSESETVCGCTNVANEVDATDAFIGAGDLNLITLAGSGSFIGGGGFAWAAGNNTSHSSTIEASDSFIGAGDDNLIAGTMSFLGSGEYNSNSGIQASSVRALATRSRATATDRSSRVVAIYGLPMGTRRRPDRFPVTIRFSEPATRTPSPQASPSSGRASTTPSRKGAPTACLPAGT